MMDESKKHTTPVEENTSKENTQVLKLPQKKHFRGRAHCNPLSHNDSFDYPVNPDAMDWTSLYPNIPNPNVEILDVGCGYGGLTVTLAELFPSQLTLALEIRAVVCEYVKRRIDALRSQDPNKSKFQNAAIIRTNSMRYLVNYFKKGQLKKMFFCFPDPHFKAKNFKRRIVNTALLGEYAYALAPGGILYTITDVEDLFKWHVQKCSEHPFFERLSDEELAADPCVAAMRTDTEESKKVARNGGSSYVAVFRRLPDEKIPVDPFFNL